MPSSSYLWPGYGWWYVATDCHGGGWAVNPCLLDEACESPIALISIDSLSPVAVLDTVPDPAGLVTDSYANFFLWTTTGESGGWTHVLRRVLPEELPPGFYGTPSAPPLSPAAATLRSPVAPMPFPNQDRRRRCGNLRRMPERCVVELAVGSDDAAKVAHPLLRPGPEEVERRIAAMRREAARPKQVPWPGLVCAVQQALQEREVKVKVVLDPEQPETGDNVLWIDGGESGTATATVLLGQAPSLSAYSQIDDHEPQQIDVTWRVVPGSDQVQGVGPRSLFPDQPEVLFGESGGSVQAATARFQTVHLGRFTLQVTPTDTTLEDRLALTFTVVAPQRLGDAPNTYDEQIVVAANRYGIPPQYVKGHVRQESGFVNGYRYEPRTVDIAMLYGWDEEAWNDPRWEFNLYRLPRGEDGAPTAVTDEDLRIPYDQYMLIAHYDRHVFPPDWAYRCEQLDSDDGDLHLISVYYANDGWPRCSPPWMLYNDDDENNVCDPWDPASGRRRIGPCGLRMNWGVTNPTRGWYVTMLRWSDQLDIFCNDNSGMSICTDTHPFADWIAEGALTYKAQTAIAASYGLMHVLYTTAVQTQGWKKGPGRGHERHPADLLKPEVGLDLGVGYCASLVFKHSFGNCWSRSVSGSDEYSAMLNNGVGRYRTGWRHESWYAAMVASYATRYKPIGER